MQISFTGFLNTKAYGFALHDCKNNHVLSTYEINTHLDGNDAYDFARANVQSARDFFSKENINILKLNINQYYDIENPEYIDFMVNDKNLKVTGQDYPMWKFLTKMLDKISKTPDEGFFVDLNHLTSNEYDKYWANHPYKPQGGFDFLRAESKIFNPDEIKYYAKYFLGIAKNVLESFHLK